VRAADNAIFVLEVNPNAHQLGLGLHSDGQGVSENEFEDSLEEGVARPLSTLT
jgi:hypothetical protein